MGTTPAANDLPAATQLAVERTHLAHDRTLMAWVRTATSLISFGFTIYKFFEYVREQQQAVATVANVRGMRALRAKYGALVPYSLSTFVAALIGLLGGLSLLAVYFRQ